MRKSFVGFNSFKLCDHGWRKGLGICIFLTD